MQPEDTGERLRVSDAAVATPGLELRRRRLDDLDELLGIELRPAGHETARKPDLDELVGVADAGMHATGTSPLAGGVAGFLEQFALGAAQRRLAGGQLAGRE